MAQNWLDTEIGQNVHGAFAMVFEHYSVPQHNRLSPPNVGTLLDVASRLSPVPPNAELNDDTPVSWLINPQGAKADEATVRVRIPSEEYASIARTVLRLAAAERQEMPGE